MIVKKAIIAKKKRTKRRSASGKVANTYHVTLISRHAKRTYKKREAMKIADASATK